MSLEPTEWYPRELWSYYLVYLHEQSHSGAGIRMIEDWASKEGWGREQWRLSCCNLAIIHISPPVSFMLLATSLLIKLIAICLTCCDSVLLTHLQPGIHYNPKVLLVKAVSQPLASQTVPTHGFILLYEYSSFLNVVKFLLLQASNFSILPKRTMICNIKHST